MATKIVTTKQLQGAKYKGKFIDAYPLHYSQKDKNGKWITVYEIRGVSSTIKENFQTVEEILGN